MTSRRRHDWAADTDLDALCHMVRGVLDCDGVVMAVWDDTVAVGADGLTSEDAGTLAERFHPDQAAPPDRVTDAEIAVDLPSARSVIEEMGFASVMRSALTLGGENAGLLFFLWSDEADRETDQTLLKALVRSCESALEFGRETSLSESLPEIDSLALHADTFPALMPAIQRVVSAALGPVGVGLSVYDDESGLLVTTEGSFGLPASVTASYSIDPNDLHSNAARVFETQRPYTSNQVIGDPAIIQNYPIAFGIESMIALPLIVSGRSTGVLMVANKEGGFSSSDVEKALTLTPQISIAVELARLNEAKRFHFASEQVLAELSAATYDPILDLDRFRPVFRWLAAIIRANRLEIVTEDGTVLMYEQPEPLTEQQFDTSHPCGILDGQSLRMRAVRSRGSAFSRTESRLVNEAARLLAEGLARTTTLRHEAELSQHRERQRIADDLHDDVSQLLLSAQKALEPSTELEGAAGESARRATELVHRAEAALRDAIFVLNSSQHTLSEALTEVVSAVNSHWSLEVKLDVDSGVDPFVSSKITGVLARGTREALMNTVKHAGPATSRVIARLVGQNDSHIEVDIVDNGRGADTAAITKTNGHGLTAMRRRVGALGGTVDIDSQPGQGTKVSLRIPLTR
ncbi:histidine kinase [Stackebrandtia endophytica]|uniref:Oxygen sensor histidine kinase NreB n=1 Tax=Stackebrandtia endophytica TaxID=1496996 RepID=A0A543AVQ4_9ACTN|nr:GAF domain-containing protein [Stackebrandtia endophytica]TQL76663.1 histidine kinase [Stackebrandtia endophytica]